jgi:hypothetical protein
MKPEDPLMYSRQPDTLTYYDSAEFNLRPHTISLESILIELLFSHLLQGLLICPFLVGLQIKYLYAFLIFSMSSTWTSHLILLDLVTLIIQSY